MVRSTCLPERKNSLDEGCPRFVPRDRVEDALAGCRIGRAAPLGGRNAIGIVQALKRCLATDAQAASVDGVRRIPLDLDRPTFSRSDQRAAPRGTFPTDGRVPRGDARNLVLGRDHVGEDVLGRYGARRQRDRWPRTPNHL